MTELAGKSEPKRRELKDVGVIVAPTFGNFPMSKWNEWEESCNRGFTGCRWMKAWSDHIAAKYAQDLGALGARINELEQLITNKPEEKKTVKTIGGEIEVD